MKQFSFFLILIIVILGGLGIWWFNGTAPVNPSITQEQTFSVTKGEGIHQIASNLKAKSLIKDATLFYFLIKEQHADNKIQAGEFQLSPAMSASEIAKVLQTATNDVRVTIPEGKRSEEIAKILQAHFANYQPAWEDELNTHEGYLFPDTYSFAKDADIVTIITTMRNNFEKKYNSIPQVQSSPLTKTQIVKIASMVEREAKFPEDRPLVASVILNRINADMPLDIDATIQYAIGTSKNWWPTLQDSGSNVMPNSLYNSYTHNGLPPTPISNPGLDVLTAVANAPKTDYLFYVSDNAGHNHYAKTLDEHNTNIKKYNLQ